MNLVDLQQYVSDRITAVPALAALGTPIKFSFFTTDDQAKTAINAAVREKGVCFEIGVPSANGDPTKPFNRFTTVDVNFDFYVAESPTVVHSPSELALVQLVAGAIQARVDPHTPNARCTNYMAAESVHGFVLHILSFTIPALIPAPA